MEIYVVGGAVRDQLLGLTPKDFDYVVVGATPADMIAQGFEQVGADFPVFLHPETKDEYALARVERKVGDGYHGFSVEFDPTITLEADLYRRDLTINAMAMKDGEVFDPYGGQNDLKNKVLRHVSEAFEEDPLRVVRLCRFFARYNDFEIAPETLSVSQAMVKRGDLNHLPNERFWAEMTKVMGEKDPLHFFYGVGMTGMDDNTNFFFELFGRLHVRKIAKIQEVLKVVAHRYSEAEIRLMHFIALTAGKAKTISSAPVRTQKLFNNVQRVREMEAATAENVFELLKHAKAWSQSPDVYDLIDAVIIMEQTERCNVRHVDLHHALKATKMVTAEQFPGVEGKALGEAIANGRKEAIAKVLCV